LYKLSVIAKLVYKYNFTNIVYDYPNFLIDLVPVTTEKIIFVDDFCDNILDLFDLPNLQFVQVGPNFINFDNVRDMPHSITNQREILLKTLANICSVIYENITDKHMVYCSNKNDEALYTSKMTKYSIDQCNLTTILNALKNREIDENIFKLIIQTLQQCIYKGNLCEYINNQYERIFDNIDKITWHNDKYFFNDKMDLMTELINDMLYVSDNQKIFLEWFFDKLVQEYHCRNISRFPFYGNHMLYNALRYFVF